MYTPFFQPSHRQAVEPPPPGRVHLHLWARPVAVRGPDVDRGDGVGGVRGDGREGLPAREGQAVGRGGGEAKDTRYRGKRSISAFPTAIIGTTIDCARRNVHLFLCFAQVLKNES